jgi:hypothetical protein
MKPFLPGAENQSALRRDSGVCKVVGSSTCPNVRRIEQKTYRIRKEVQSLGRENETGAVGYFWSRAAGRSDQ